MKLGLKLMLIGALLVVLMIPITMLHGLVWERQQRGLEVAEDIARSSSRAQQLVGPLLVLSGEETLRQEREIEREDRTEKVIKDVRELRWWVVAPETLAFDHRLSTSERRRGLFGALLYTDALKAKARFVLPPAPPIEGERIAYRVLGASLVFGVGDGRGIQTLRLKADGHDLRLEPGGELAWLPEGVHAALPDSLASHGQSFDVELAGELQGTQALDFVPLAGEAHVTLTADWPHPSFQGQRLPAEPKIDAQGFSAEWKVSRLSSQADQALARCGIATSCSALDGAFGVRLVDPVDRYLKTDRAMKYALLFLVLVFGAVFFMETVRGVDVHALQYGLTGLALAMFFLLLLSLSEHIGFGPAYFVAAFACVALISTYLSAVLGGRARGLAFGVLLAGLYGLLYGLLQSEDYALLMGALALFALLATVMLLTRRLDWSAARMRATLSAQTGA